MCDVICWMPFTARLLTKLRRATVSGAEKANGPR
jgi:hypothetical protein